MATGRFKPTEKEIKDFLKEFGFTQKEVKEKEGFSGGSCAVSEMAINFGYVFLPKRKKWINKNNSFYSDTDELIVKHLRTKE